MASINNMPSPEQIQRQIDEQDKLYKEELKKNSIFEVRKAIRARIKELKKVLYQLTQRN